MQAKKRVIGKDRSTDCSYDFETRFYVGEGTAIVMLLLTVDELRVLVLFDRTSHVFIRERSKLLDADNRDILYKTND